MNIFRRLGVVLVGSVVLTASLYAAPITGSFDIGGSSATVTAIMLSFGCSSGINGAPCPGPAGAGNFNIPTATGGFAPLANTSGYIKTIASGPQPVNTAFNLSNWIILNAAPNYVLDLQFVYEGIDSAAACGAAPAAGQTCTPLIPAIANPNDPTGISPYNLQNTQTGSTASFSVAGVEREISSGIMTPFRGTFTAQFDTPYQTLLANLAAGQAVNSYSATFTITAVPEPATTSAVAGGLLLMLGAGLRRFRRG